MIFGWSRDTPEALKRRKIHFSMEKCPIFNFKKQAKIVIFPRKGGFSCVLEPLECLETTQKSSETIQGGTVDLCMAGFVIKHYRFAYIRQNVKKNQKLSTVWKKSKIGHSRGVFGILSMV